MSGRSLGISGVVRRLYLIADPAEPCQPLRLNGIRGSCRLRWPGLEHRRARNADAENVDPSLVEVENMGVEQRGEKVLYHHHQANPGHQTITAEEPQVRRPHCIK